MNEAPPLAPLPPGFLLGGEFRVDKKLGEGAFGAVYKVTRITNGQIYAMKVEGVHEPIQVLKLEVVVLRELAEKQKVHVCRIISQGRTHTFNYVIMTLVGQSLQDLKMGSGGKFSLSTALRVGIQCLEALEDLHGIGFLHRDVKPGNFAIGRREVREHRKIFILDFGMARQYRKPTGELRTPRQAAGFRGTVRYAPLNCHRGEELARKDDLESWFYQQIEFTVGRVEWHDMIDMDTVMRMKERARWDGTLCRGCPEEYTLIIKYIDSMEFTDEPQYSRIVRFLRKMMEAHGFHEMDPYDWERRPPQLPSIRPPAFNFGRRHR